MRTHISPHRALTAAVALLALAFAPQAMAVIHLNASGTGDYPTIQDALDVAPSGEVIVLANGVYTGPGNRNLEIYTDITIRSAGGYEDCILDIQGSPTSHARGFALNDEPQATVLGVTIRGGYHTMGGAVQMGYADLVFEDCLFQDNHAVDQGGAWHGGDGGLVTFRRCVFSGNTAGAEGGALCGTAASQVTLERCTLVRNGAPHGGGLYLTTDAYATIENTIIAFSLDGGAIETYYHGGTTISCLTRFANRGDTAAGVDPLLVDPMATPFPDVRLAAGSPCRASVSDCGETGGAGDESLVQEPLYGLNADGTGLFAGINDATEQLPAGATIVLEDGTYTDVDHGGIALTGQSLVSRSNDPTVCRIDLTGQSHWLVFHAPGGYGEVLIRGISVVGANVHDPGLFVADNSVTTLENCVFEDNFIAGVGFLVMTSHGTNFEAIDCAFLNNTVTGRDLILSNGVTTLRRCELGGNNVGRDLMNLGEMNATLSDVVITGNTAESIVVKNGGTVSISGTVADNQADGQGVICCTDSDLELQDCEILDNVSSNYTVLVNSGDIDATDCLWRGNQCAQAGGGLNLHYAKGQILRCRFENNVTTQATGGGIHFAAENPDLWYSGILEITDCEFLSNSSPDGGSALNVSLRGITDEYSMDEYQSLTLYLNGCTFHGNINYSASRGQVELKTYNDGGGFEGTGTLHATLDACLITGGVEARAIQCPTSNHTSLEVHCSNLYGNDGGDWEGTELQEALQEPGNLNADPQYCDAAAGDLSLYDTSPCLAENALCNILIGANGEGCSAGVGVDDLVAAPRTGLVGNHPNPFNPRTTIRFELAAPGAVTLQIYDLSGRLVRTLLVGTVHQAGPAEVVWDGRDDSQGQAPAGIYLVRMVAGGQESVRKVAMIK